MYECRSFIRRKWSGGWEMLGQKMGGCKAFLRRKRNGGWEVTERLYRAVGENSIDFSRIPYRLFSGSIGQTLGQHGSNDLIVWENRSVPIVLPLGWHGRNDLIHRQRLSRDYQGAPYERLRASPRCRAGRSRASQAT